MKKGSFGIFNFIKLHFFSLKLTPTIICIDDFNIFIENYY